jgi:hypothetical protein
VAPGSLLVCVSGEIFFCGTKGQGSVLICLDGGKSLCLDKSVRVLSCAKASEGPVFGADCVSLGFERVVLSSECE